MQHPSPASVSAPSNAPPVARAAVRALSNSKIREVANAGMGRAGVLPFWFGEPDQVTPQFIRQAAIDSINAGETFYSQNFGIPPLRAALAEYTTRLHGSTTPDSIAVTSSGMSALMQVFQALIGPGDRVVAVTPLWPNLIEGPRVLGAEMVRVGLDFDAKRGFHLDLDRLLEALTPATRVLIINSPGNPTGWTLNGKEQAAILAHCRRHGIWILADDAYERIYFEGDGAAAPSFLDMAGRDERVVSANTFSKSWLMTGWRLGWVTGPAALIEDIGKLIEYNTSCAPTFVQRAGVVAVRDGEAITQGFVARLKAARDRLHTRLAGIEGIQAVAPAGAMYAFFRVAGVTDSLALCKRLVAEHGLGLAPGIAFGQESEGFVRWCFAASDASLDEGVARLRRGLAR